MMDAGVFIFNSIKIGQNREEEEEKKLYKRFVSV